MAKLKIEYSVDVSHIEVNAVIKLTNDTTNPAYDKITTINVANMTKDDFEKALELLDEYKKKQIKW